MIEDIFIQNDSRSNLNMKLMTIVISSVSEIQPEIAICLSRIFCLSCHLNKLSLLLTYLCFNTQNVTRYGSIYHFVSNNPKSILQLDILVLLNASSHLSSRSLKDPFSRFWDSGKICFSYLYGMVWDFVVMIASQKIFKENP